MTATIATAATRPVRRTHVTRPSSAPTRRGGDPTPAAAQRRPGSDGRDGDDGDAAHAACPHAAPARRAHVVRRRVHAHRRAQQRCRRRRLRQRWGRRGRTACPRDAPSQRGAPTRHGGESTSTVARSGGADDDGHDGDGGDAARAACPRDAPARRAHAARPRGAAASPRPPWRAAAVPTTTATTAAAARPTRRAHVTRPRSAPTRRGGDSTSTVARSGGADDDGDDGDGGDAARAAYPRDEPAQRAHVARRRVQVHRGAQRRRRRRRSRRRRRRRSPCGVPT